ncbi:proline--tRNA ligase [archaeon]|nr:proline--tRNA ligase [archaeon]
MKKEKLQGITVKKKDNFSEWYTQVISKSELADYSIVSGCYVLRPSSYFIWERVRDFFDKKIKKSGVKNAYFPLLIPEQLFNKEKQHVEGFNPEVAWVTKTGDTDLKEKLAIRPTSETIMYYSYKKWIRSHNDLPLRLNQWCNVVRWEFKHPIPFLRSREFLWQEGHTAFANNKDAEKEVKEILSYYKQVFEDLYAIPVIEGKKSEGEKFAGADYTLSVETFLPSGKAIQGATSHFLGQNFSKAFDINFTDKSGDKDHVWQNSWGLSTRTIGIMVMMHADDYGLVLPPKVAENKVVIVPIYSKENKDKIMKKAIELKTKLNKFDVLLDDRENYSPGWKFHEWELKGIPVRIEIGPKDLAKKQVVLFRRDNHKKENVGFVNLQKKVEVVLEDIQNNLFKKAQDFIKKNTVEVKTLKDFEKATKENKLIKTYWCGCDEDKIKDEYGVKILTIPFDQPKKKNKCIFTGKEGNLVYMAKSY